MNKVLKEPIKDGVYSTESKKSKEIKATEQREVGRVPNIVREGTKMFTKITVYERLMDTREWGVKNEEAAGLTETSENSPSTFPGATKPVLIMEKMMVLKLLSQNISWWP